MFVSRADHPKTWLNASLPQTQKKRLRKLFKRSLLPDTMPKACDNVLAIIGLSSNEAAVYLALLRNPNATAYQIAAKTGLKPSTVHDNLNSLIRQRMATRKRIKRGKQSVFQYNPADRNQVLKRIQKMAERQLSPTAKVEPTIAGPKKARKSQSKSQAH